MCFFPLINKRQLCGCLDLLHATKQRHFRAGSVPVCRGCQCIWLAVYLSPDHLIHCTVLSRESCRDEGTKRGRKKQGRGGVGRESFCIVSRNIVLWMRCLQCGCHIVCVYVCKCTRTSLFSLLALPVHRDELNLSTCCTCVYITLCVFTCMCNVGGCISPVHGHIGCLF